MRPPAIRLLIVDDSALVRSVLAKALARFTDIELVGSARDPYEARDLLVALKPDVMTLDVEMPRMDGISFLRKLMAVLPTPTIVLSSLTQASSELRAQALAAGAVAVLAKPTVGVQHGLEHVVQPIVDAIRRAARTKVERAGGEAEAPPASAALDATTDKVIGIGASTGGVAALGRILPLFPASAPGIVLVQHMAAGFTADFARRLDAQCEMRVSEAVDGQRILRGHLLVAPGGTRHCEVVRVGGEYRIRLVVMRPVSGHVPSVDVLFHSLAHSAAKNAAACLLTGMGSDGAEGLLRMRIAGGYTLAQDKASSAVWGMPAAAEALGAAVAAMGLMDLPRALMRWAGAAATAG
jgi:two-component system, chemotaxis family, protein-glutamate methylesterase/glutaminase